MHKKEIESEVIKKYCLIASQLEKREKKNGKKHKPNKHWRKIQQQYNMYLYGRYG